MRNCSFSPRPPGQATGANLYFPPGGERGQRGRRVKLIIVDVRNGGIKSLLPIRFYVTLIFLKQYYFDGCTSTESLSGSLNPVLYKKVKNATRLNKYCDFREVNVQHLKQNTPTPFRVCLCADCQTEIV